MYIYIICIHIYYIRPRHDLQIKKKKAWSGDEKPGLPGGKAVWADCPCKILNSSSRIHIDLFNRIHYKLILLTLLFKSLFFITNLNCSYVLLLDIFSVITQLDFWYFKSAFANRKFSYFQNVLCMLQTWSLNTKNNLILYWQ